MEKGLYLAIFAISFIIFLISVFVKDWELQLMFAGISFVAFSALALQSLNIQVMTYDETLATWVSYQTTDYFIFMGIAFILSIISFFNCWSAIADKPWKKLSGNWYQQGRPGSRF